MKTKIAIVDDELLILEGLKMLLAPEKSVEVTISSTGGEDFLYQLSSATPENFPDIVLIDVQMKPMDGFELVEILRIKFPVLKIMILSTHYKSSILGYMVKLGVSAFLPKNSNKKTLLNAIGEVHKTGVFFTAEDHQMLNSYMNNPPKKNSLFCSAEDLSEREKEVVKLICEEMTNQEIAERLFLSPRTVESHRQRILDKTGAKNTVGIVIFAIVNEIFPLKMKIN